MLNSSGSKLTGGPFAPLFLEPKNPLHRQYEALRAFFVEGLPSAQAARRFGYTPGSFRILCHQLRQDPTLEFFLPTRRTPRQDPQRDRVREQIIALRKHNLSIYDISRALEEQGEKRSPVAVSLILKEEGFARLPRRPDEERPLIPRALRAEVADVRSLDLSPRQFRTQFGGLFLFLPFLARLPWKQITESAGLPGSVWISTPFPFTAKMP